MHILYNLQLFAMSAIVSLLIYHLLLSHIKPSILFISRHEKEQYAINKHFFLPYLLFRCKHPIHQTPITAAFGGGVDARAEGGVKWMLHRCFGAEVQGCKVEGKLRCCL